MIKIIDVDFLKLDEFRAFCEKDSFGTRIYSHFLSYGTKYNFVDFWVEIDENNSISSAICRLESDFILCLSENSQGDEISAFLNFQNMNSVTFNCIFDDKINIVADKFFKGDVLTYYYDPNFKAQYPISTPDLKEYHNLLLTCESEDFFVPEYLQFLSDIRMRLNKNLCELFGVVVDDTLVSCAMTVSQTENSVILGAVATHPMHRKHGYGGCVVKSLAQIFCDYDNVYIYTTIEKNTRFYESLGFKVSGKWIKYTFGG